MRIGRCIKRDDKMFWERLIYELPHRRQDEKEEEEDEEEQESPCSSNYSLLSSYISDGRLTR